MKEAENIARAGALEKQMLSLIRLQECVSCKGSEHVPVVSFPKNMTDDSITSISPSLSEAKELSDELPLVHENELRRGRSDSDHGQFRANEVGDGPDGPIHDYIDQGSVKNLRSRRADAHSQQDSASARSVPLRSALKKVSAIPELVENDKMLEDVLGDHDLENHKSYSQKELDHAKKVLRRAFVEFFRGLGLLSNYRYSTKRADNNSWIESVGMNACIHL